MIYTVIIQPSAKRGLEKFKKSDPATFKKASKLLHELAEHPRTGTGHPEPLRQGGGVTYSRRITAHDRLVYDIYDDVVVVSVLSVVGHYDDK